MKRINIQSQKHGLVWLLKENQEEVDAYLQQIASTEHWGSIEKTVVTPAVIEKQQVEVSPGVFEEQDVEISPEIVEVIPATYSVEVIDVTEEVEAEEAIKKNLARMQFGMLIMAELAQRNQKRLTQGTITVPLILTIEEKLAKVQRLLLNGSAGLALQALIDADIPELPVEEKAYFVTKIQSYLASEG